jgi:hypothetical protein
MHRILKLRSSLLLSSQSMYLSAGEMPIDAAPRGCLALNDKTSQLLNNDSFMAAF